jgi:hypothetical protein
MYQVFQRERKRTKTNWKITEGKIKRKREERERESERREVTTYLELKKQAKYAQQTFRKSIKKTNTSKTHFTVKTTFVTCS